MSEYPVALSIKLNKKFPKIGTNKINTNKSIIMKIIIIALTLRSKKDFCSIPYILFAVTIIEFVPLLAKYIPTTIRTNRLKDNSVLPIEGVKSSAIELSNDIFK